MEDKKFWDLIDLARTDRGGAYRAALEALTNDELIDFYWDYEDSKKMMMAKRFIDQLPPPVSENELEDIADSVVAKGLEYFDSVLLDPTTFPRSFPRRTARSYFNEDAATLYEQRTGKPLPFRERSE